MVADKKVSSQTACIRILYALVFTLVFEGLVRKLVPSALSTVIFFVKDIICIYAMFVVLKTHLDKYSKKIVRIWRNAFLAFIPLILYTFFLDPPLALFGARQYMLFAVVAMLMPVAFKSNIAGLKRFFLIMATTLIPTTVIAVLQNALPPTHWLNLSVGGDTLDNFSAAGYLRVSSTFSFTAQYSFYLNVATAFFAACLFMQPRYRKAASKMYGTFYLVFIAIMLLVGAFITGGRTGVLGCGAVLFFGLLFISWRFPNWFITKGVIGLILGFITFSAIRVIKPEFFAAYEARSQGTEEVSHSEEVEDRLLGNFLGGDWFWQRDVSTIIIGQGLGVMTNGSVQISSYAAGIRAVLWTEGDFSTILWEGGLYMVFVWYGLRLYMIYFSYKNWMATKRREYASAASFFLAYILVLGIIGTLSTQAPIAIWWWMSIGAIVVIRQSDEDSRSTSSIPQPLSDDEVLIPQHTGKQLRTV